MAEISLTRLSGGNTPADGSDPRTFPAIWNASATAIEDALAEGGGGSITVSDTAPTDPAPGQGDLWWDSANGKLFVYYVDGDSSQWVDAAGPSVAVQDTAPTGYEGQLWLDSTDGSMYTYYTDPGGTASSWIGAVSRSGGILQVIQAAKTDEFSLATEDTWTDITDLSLDITPRSTNSKIYLIAEIGYLDGSAAMALGFRFTRDGTAIGLGDQVGSIRQRVTFARIVDTAVRGETASGTYLDSPSTSSTITYKLQLNKMDPGTAYINRASTDSDANNRFRALSSITAIEVAG